MRELILFLNCMTMLQALKQLYVELAVSKEADYSALCYSGHISTHRDTYKCCKTSKHVFETAVRGMLIHTEHSLYHKSFIQLRAVADMSLGCRCYRCSAVSQTNGNVGKNAEHLLIFKLFVRSNSVCILQKNLIKSVFITSLFYNTSSSSHSLTDYIDLQV